MNDEKLKCALDLSRRLPPQRITEYLNDFLDLIPDCTESLLVAIDQPLRVAYDTQANREYLLCEYNRDADSYRSPCSNQFDPAFEGGTYPSDRLRKLEIHLNTAFEAYGNLYYTGGLSSVYCWDLDAGKFGVAILLKKIMDENPSVSASWDSIHIVAVHEKPSTKIWSYQMTSTAQIWFGSRCDGDGKLSLGGSLTKQSDADVPMTEGFSEHVANIGRMVEDMENKIRQVLDAIYFGKTKDIINGMREMEMFPTVLKANSEFKEDLQNYFNRKSIGD